MSKCRGAQDRQLASHVLAVHRDGRAPRPEGLSDTLTPDQLRAYIAEAKQHQPFIPEDLTGEGVAVVQVPTASTISPPVVSRHCPHYWAATLSMSLLSRGRM